MRFLLDNDVDVGLLGVLMSAGHEAFTAAAIGLAGMDAAKDDVVSIAAQDRGATLITHDREFTDRRKRNTYGRHVFLTCHQVDAAELIEEHLSEMVAELEPREDVVLQVSRGEGVTVHEPRWD